MAPHYPFRVKKSQIRTSSGGPALPRGAESRASRKFLSWKARQATQGTVRNVMGRSVTMTGNAIRRFSLVSFALVMSRTGILS
jgi:hypothetical protein